MQKCQYPCLARRNKPFQLCSELIPSQTSAQEQVCTLVSWLDFPFLQGGSFHSVSAGYLGLMDNKRKTNKGYRIIAEWIQEFNREAQRILCKQLSVMIEHLVPPMQCAKFPVHEKRTLEFSPCIRERER